MRSPSSGYLFGPICHCESKSSLTAWKRCDWPNLQQAIRISPPWTNKHIKSPHTHSHARIKSQSCLKFSMLHGTQWEVKGAHCCVKSSRQPLRHSHPCPYGRVCVCSDASCVNPELLRRTYMAQCLTVRILQWSVFLLLLVFRHKMVNGFLWVSISTSYSQMSKNIFLQLFCDVFLPFISFKERNSHLRIYY